MNESDRLIDSRSGFHEVLHTAFENIAGVGCREILLCDDDFADWPLGSVETLDLLTIWARPHRRLQVVARSFDGFGRQHPRWVTWRRQWSHVVSCRSALDDAGETGNGGSAVAMPSLLVAPGLLALRLSDRLRFRGRLTTQVDAVESLRQQFDAISQRSVDSFPATTLGL